jgi:hypothetical protein
MSTITAIYVPYLPTMAKPFDFTGPAPITPEPEYMEKHIKTCYECRMGFLKNILNKDLIKALCVEKGYDYHTLWGKYDHIELPSISECNFK